MVTILAVDRDEARLGVYRHWFEEVGWSVRVATDGAEARERIDGAIGAAVVHQQVWTTSGDALRRAITSTGSDCAIVVVSAFGAHDRSETPRCDRYASKPMQSDDLVAAVERELRQSKSAAKS